MANLTTLLSPVSVSVINTPAVSAFAPGLRFTNTSRLNYQYISNSNTLYELYGFNYELEDLYLIINRNINVTDTIITLPIKAFSPFSFTFPSGIEGSLIILAARTPNLPVIESGDLGYSIKLYYKTKG